MNFSVLGCGRWGTFIAWYLNKIGNNVTIYGREYSTNVLNLQINRKNEYVELPETIEITTNLNDAIYKSEYIVISISSQNLREFMKEVMSVEESKNKKFILCMKGLEAETGTRLSEILIDAGVNKNNIAVWVGPGHVQSFVAGIPSVMVIDSYNPDYSIFLVKQLKSDLIRFYQGIDIIGSEIGAAAKNVIGIAAGMLDGIGYYSLKGGLMARGAREISRLIKACGGNEFSAYGLCHLGDYEATLFSEFSHNRMWGEKFIKNQNFEKLAEGVATTTALLNLAKKYNCELPITQTVFDIIHGKIKKEDAIKGLIGRDIKEEF